MNKVEKEIKKYNQVFQDEGYRSLGGCMGLRFLPDVCAGLNFKSVLDVGCGPGWSVTEFLRRKYIARGIEPSDYLYQHELRVLAGLDIVKKGRADDIPVPAESFDLVFCTDVMEHIPEENIEKCIKEMIRVSKKYIFCTISYQKAVCFPKLGLHVTVKTKDWWDKQFMKYRLKRQTLRDVKFDYHLFRKI